MSTSSGDHPAGWWVIAPLSLFGFLIGVAILTTRSAYGASDLMMLALLYASLAGGLFSLGRLLALGGIALELTGALLMGLVWAWHLREQIRTPGSANTLWTAEGMSVFLAAACVVAGTQYVLGRRSFLGPPAARRLVVALLASAITFVLVGVMGYRGSDTFRWHLLRHNSLVGTPAFHLLSPRVDELEELDWTAHAGGSPIAQAAWQLASGTVDVVAESDQSQTPPDVVFVMLDTLRADALAAYGGDSGWMPALNRLADQGLVFTNLLANASWTRPSVASFFTGLAPEEHGAAGWSFSISPGVVTMAEVFKRRGYDTAAFVANHAAINSGGAFDRGFDVFEPLNDSTHAYARADYVSGRVSSWLEEREPTDDGSPLFLYVHYLDPHVPYLSSRAPDTFVDRALSIEPVARYSDELQFLDRHLARLFASLDERLHGRRVTLVTSDHGEEFGEHDARGHGQTLYSEVLDIPAVLLLSDERGSTPRGTVEHALEGRDFFELLVAAAGEKADVPALAATLSSDVRVASITNTMDRGRSSIIPYLIRPYRHSIYSRMVQRGGWKLIWSAYGPTYELYDLAADPEEVDNRAGRRPDLLRSLKDELDVTPPRWRRSATIEISEETLERLRSLGYIR